MSEPPFPLVTLDLETTGTDPQVDRVVEIALVFAAPGTEPITWASRVNPGVPIPPRASEIHGIWDWDVQDQPTFKDLVPQLQARLSSVPAVSGYNARRFDLPLLRKEFERAGAPFPLEGVPVIDALDLWQTLQPRNLTGAVQAWCARKHEGAHGAAADARAALDVLLAQLAAHPALPATPAELAQAALPEEARRWVDPDGKLVRDDLGRVCVGFGQHKGKPLDAVPVSYLDWMANKAQLPRPAVEIVRGFLARAG